MPHILVEKGDMTLEEFEQHLKGKADFIRGMKKDNSAERKVSHLWQSWGTLGTCLTEPLRPLTLKRRA